MRGVKETHSKNLPLPVNRSLPIHLPHNLTPAVPFRGVQVGIQAEGVVEGTVAPAGRVFVDGPRMGRPGAAALAAGDGRATALSAGRGGRGEADVTQLERENDLFEKGVYVLP